jgi:hypothetical protein
MIILTLMYSGLFYMTSNLGDDLTGIKSEGTSFFHYILFPILLIPNVYFYLNWMRFIIINFIILIYLKDLKLFRIVTLGLMDSNEFYRNYVEKQSEIFEET